MFMNCGFINICKKKVYIVGIFVKDDWLECL